MEQWRFRVVYLVLLPAIAVAAGVLGYYAYQTADQLRRLGEKSIAHSILLLVENGVDRLENRIITTDNAIFRTVDFERPRRSLRTWRAAAEKNTPSVIAVIVLDSTKEVLAYSARISRKDKDRFLEVFLEETVPDLKLEELSYNRLKHLHRSYDDRNFLISYKAVRHEGDRFYTVAHYDVGFLVRNVFPKLFVSETGKQLYNVVDEENQRVFGPSLYHAGDYVVSRRFPTTLYNWRLQVAPREAPLLESKERTSGYYQAALIGLSLGIILLGTVFVLLAADKERRLNALKSEFIANVSHELKTPLSVIRMFGEMLMTGRVRDDGKRQQYLESICSESIRLSGLIENVLDFAVLERGKPRYQMQDRDLADLVSRAIETFRYRFEREGADVVFKIDGDAPLVRVDEQAILLAIINLLDNAVKYGGATPVEVTVETLDEEVQIRVHDHGPGIPSADLKRVFERFYRTRKNPKTRGTGIGLTLVKQIAEDHKGRAWAENAPEGGALVGFSLPRRRPKSVEAPPGKLEERQETGTMESARPNPI
jgi:two-component system phosphate regulon sensor histidine kinase PhoR